MPLAIANGKVFVTPTGNWSNYMHSVALDALTGGKMWRTHFQPGSSMNPPSYHEGVVYTPKRQSRHGHPALGTQLQQWHRQVEHPTPHNGKGTSLPRSPI